MAVILPEYKVKRNYVWQNLSLSLQSFAALLFPSLFSGWEDYSTQSTVIGWSSFVTKSIKYKVIGKTVFVSYNIIGVSNSTNASFTVPFINAAGSPAAIDVTSGVNNAAPSWALSSLPTGSDIVTCLFEAGAWTNSGTKSISGQFFYEID